MHRAKERSRGGKRTAYQRTAYPSGSAAARRATGGGGGIFVSHPPGRSHADLPRRTPRMGRSRLRRLLPAAGRIDERPIDAPGVRSRSLARIAVLHNPARDSFKQAYDEIFARLLAQFGTPQEQRAPLSEDCAARLRHVSRRARNRGCTMVLERGQHRPGADMVRAARVHRGTPRAPRHLSRPDRRRAGLQEQGANELLQEERAQCEQQHRDARDDGADRPARETLWGRPSRTRRLRRRCGRTGAHRLRGHHIDRHSHNRRPWKAGASPPGDFATGICGAVGAPGWCCPDITLGRAT